MGTIRRSQVIKACKAWADDGYEEGDNNWTIFSKILDECFYYDPQYKQNQPWCHNFVNCMFLLEAEPKDREDTEKKYDAQNYLFQPSKNNLSCGCVYGAGYFRDNDHFYSIKAADIGDIIYFGKRGEESHVGIIIDIDYDEDGDVERVYTVEGNKGNKVAYGNYSANYNRISGVGKVAFDDYYDDLDGNEDTDSTPDPIPDPTPAPTPSPEPPVIDPTGEEYVVNVNTWLNVRNGCGTSYPVVDKLFDGDIVTVYEKKNGWGRISTTMDLWVCMDYLM